MNEHYPFELAPLPYPANGLEPYIDEQTVLLHHNAHQGGYVKKLNAALECAPDPLKCLSLEQLIVNAPMLPLPSRREILQNAGGVYAHELYFDGMTDFRTSTLPVGELACAIDRCFGSYQAMKKEITKIALSQFGSGWAWLVCCSNGNLQILSTPNQEIPLTMGLRPILVVDVWEHAYYLKYYNKRTDYIASWWNLVDWGFANLNYIQ